MRHSLKATFLATAVLFLPRSGDAAPLPWKQAGLSEREAAAHLLNRFAYGPRPGEVDAAVKMGLDAWLERQLAGLPDGKLEDRLTGRLPALALSTAELAKTYPPVGAVLQEARQAGILSEALDPADLLGEDRKGKRDEVRRFARERGYRPQRELVGQLMAAKLARAVGSESQLAEVMTDFWFNHFNVSATDNQSRFWILSYERDAIRPNALGSFRDLLGATAKHPAMLFYLDNAQSSAAAASPTTMGEEMGDRPRMRRRPEPEGRRPLRPRGLNENYARELLELHTLGVDGGYTQQDVIEVARAFTGWTAIPPQRRKEAEQRLARVQRAGGLGFRVDGDFVFRADLHDAGAKTVLGTRFPAGGGLEEGEAVLDLLARHPKTAEHVAVKLAVRFVSDHPPKPLVDRLARVYLETGGDVRRMIAALAGSPEFWSRDALGAKIKSPFELTASALRTLDARLTDPRETLKWIARMGQPLYAYQAPTGYPDRATAWVNTGSLLNRMNFGLELAAGRIRGVAFDLPALSGGREPESRDEALRTYAGLLLPGRDLSSTLKLLGPVAGAPDLAKKVGKALPREKGEAEDREEALIDGDPEMQGTTRSVIVSGRLRKEEPEDRLSPTPLEQVVGVLLGSPEFQRR
ncbi:MAG TPA: DUF1800 domain-containing protein [Thermoanaerobaculia bacterium]|nr:DUF1800 domain-containing protein [Thermoanaerobaculia bacterium]